MNEWNLLEIIHPEKAQPTTSIRQMKILPFSEKNEWDLQAKYTIGNISIKTSKARENADGKRTFIIDDDDFAL